MIAFGPVSSRRLGLSLGINNIASHKDCSYACVYCQIGNTPNKTICRKKQFEPNFFYEDIKQHLQKLDITHKPDYLTFVANGEPTLDINLGIEIQMLKQFGIPIAIITNASLIDKVDVRKDLMKADWVSVKIDAVNEKIWKAINQPHEKLSFNKQIEGIRLFANDFQGKLCTETMLIEGCNDNSKSLENTASLISTLNPSVSYLSVPTRPPAMSNIQGVSEIKIAEAWNIYNQKNINTELLTGFEGTDAGFTGDIYEDILRITSVHPLHEDTIKELIKKEYSDMGVIDSLINEGQIKEVNYKGTVYYVRCYDK
jgi:wyosine [tRNA(Phe)-imidazoG37] synthetase (radical SAM superfamily)